MISGAVCARCVHAALFRAWETGLYSHIRPSFSAAHKGEYMRIIRRLLPWSLGVLASIASVVLADVAPARAQAPAEKTTLDALVSSVVRIKTHINPDGRTVEGLGRERE